MVNVLAVVVLELFTSQGCSSCPPADELLSKVRNQPGVVALAYHVDYWDHLGWRDPFSSHQWTERQSQYVRAMHLNSAYTPQMVVNGTAQFVGSQASALKSALASSRPAVGKVSVTATRTFNTVTASVHADAPSSDDVMLALFQNDATTSIRAGENSGRTANDDAIVRRLLRVTNGEVKVPVEASWRNIGVVVFLQNRETLAIDNAAVAEVR